MFQTVASTKMQDTFTALSYISRVDPIDPKMATFIDARADLDCLRKYLYAVHVLPSLHYRGNGLGLTSSTQPHPNLVILYPLDSRKKLVILHKGVFRLFKKDRVSNIHYTQPEATQFLITALKYTEKSQGEMVETNPKGINVMCEGASWDDQSCQ